MYDITTRLDFLRPEDSAESIRNQCLTTIRVSNKLAAAVESLEMH